MAQIIKLLTHKNLLKKIYWLVIFSFFLLHVWLLLNLRFTAWPEMLSYPYLLNRGYSFYGDIIHPFVPVLPISLFFVYKFFGISVMVLQAFTITIILFTDILLFWLANRFFGIAVALFTLLIYILLQVSFEGNGLWFDLAVTPFFVAAFYTSFKWFREGKIYYAAITGILLAWGLAIKLSSIWVVGTVGLLMVIKGIRKTGIKEKMWELTMFMISIVLTSMVIVLGLFVFSNMGSFYDFLYWGIYYPLFIVTLMPGYFQPPVLRQLLILSMVTLPANIGGILVIFGAGKLDGDKKLLFILTLSFFFSSTLFGLHRFAYFHLQPALPFLALIIALSLNPKVLVEIIERDLFKKVLFLSAGVSFIFLLLWTGRIIKKDWHKATRFIEPRVVKAVAFISQGLSKDEPVFFYNVPSQYFVLSGILPSRPWVDTFPWYLELPGMQNKIVAKLEKEKIRWVLYSPFQEGKSYDLGVYKPKLIDEYIKKKFTVSQQIEPWLLLLERKK